MTNDSNFIISSVITAAIAVLSAWDYVLKKPNEGNSEKIHRRFKPIGTNIDTFVI